MSARAPAAVRTAFRPVLIVGVEQHQPAGRRVVLDPLAVRFLPPRQRLTVHAARLPSRRERTFRENERIAPGVWGCILCRKRYADERVREALDAGIRQFVFLGAGLDTRPYRLVLPAGGTAFEVDMPVNADYKRERLRAVFGEVPARARLLGLDLEDADLAPALAARGFRIGEPTMFVWEAVTQYLAADGVRATLGFLSGAAPGSRLIFTFVREDFVNGDAMYGAEPVYRHFCTGGTWRFGIAPENVAALLAEYGWTEREQVGRDEFVARYLAPAGRADLPVSEIERFVSAVKE
ncbi:hypothetical protein BJF79_43650 [Actinomadura sp. CNU-125]|uniref:class I SAM-dependent methyltransferase n=1 Tax=Actinomadura sp. CNU-125 TaxID=1904961 RepID=UPI0009642F57|nr:SAM-dependent methyltransferase [Actinomadura sp. CNU-125]OLT26335.1 hypothetical protein BJF79_43650 [Actinomadura sp. CNU-125]